jgi:hypothetical protein
MTPADFDAAFNGDWETVARLETHQVYMVPGEEAALEAFRAGQPRPVWSVRTDPWLARIALTSAPEELTGKPPKRWLRCRIVQHPRNLYTDHEIEGYRESQAAGEQIFIAPLEADPALTGLRQDFWGFGLGTTGAFVIIMDYDAGGHWLGAERTTDPVILDRCLKQWNLARSHSVPLNEYLAPGKEARKAA